MAVDSPKALRYRIVYPTRANLTSLGEMLAESWRDTYPSEENGVSKEWVEQEITSWYEPHARHRWRQAYQSTLTNPQHYFYRIALTSDKEVIGFIGGSKLRYGQELRDLYVAKAYQGIGVAHHLLGDFLAWIEPDRAVTLEVADYNARAIGFYERYGFKIVPGSKKLLHYVLPVVTMYRNPHQ